MQISTYQASDRNQVIALILYLQNYDNRVDLSLEEQPDMADITEHYLATDGGFWVARADNGDVVGTIGLLKLNADYGVLKKFFVLPEYRGHEKHVSADLYQQLLTSARAKGLRALVLDTPENCHRAHHFYRKNGFVELTREQVPVQYDYPDRDSLFFELTL